MFGLITTEEMEQWAQDSERIINIRAMLYAPCGKIEGNAHEKWVERWIQKAVELGLSDQREVYGDETGCVGAPPRLKGDEDAGIALSLWEVGGVAQG